MAKPRKREICERIRKVRTDLCGPRGKSSFARKLGLSPSTYDYYESRRSPPANVLADISELAEVDLQWLITGKEADPLLRGDHPIIRRVVALLTERPGAADALGAFLDILSQSMQFPRKKASGSRSAPRVPAEEDLQRESWIPILGRSAAGVAQFWSDREESGGITKLRELIARHARGVPTSVRPAQTEPVESLSDVSVQIITLPETEPGDVPEFVAAPHLKPRWPDAFAVRIDGESMSPDIRHGDLVVLSPSVPAVDGKAAVVQLVNQIGVTCKLYHLRGDKAHLVPINEHFDPQSFPAKKVVWALRVLASVRPE